MTWTNYHYYIFNTCWEIDENAEKVNVRLTLLITDTDRNGYASTNGNTYSGLVLRHRGYSISSSLHMQRHAKNGLCPQGRLRSVWASAQSDQSSLCAWRSLGSLDILRVPSKGSRQTVQMPRLIWVFAGRTGHFAGFVMQQLKSLFFHFFFTHAFCNFMLPETFMKNNACIIMLSTYHCFPQRRDGGDTLEIRLTKNFNPQEFDGRLWYRDRILDALARTS